MCFELCGPPIDGTPEDMVAYDAWLCSLDGEPEDEAEEQEQSSTISERDALERFDEFLNEVHDVVSICGYDYDAARALKMVDEVAYREEFNNWLDSESLELE